jgi:hypothetical protein
MKEEQASVYVETQHCIDLTAFSEATNSIKLSCRMTDIICFHLAVLIIAFRGEEADSDRGEISELRVRSCYSQTILLRPINCCVEHFFKFILTNQALRGVYRGTDERVQCDETDDHIKHHL